MMAQFMPILVTALLINTLRFCTADNVYCVKPNVTSCSSCPHNYSHCASLSEYTQEAEQYFTSNTTMVFLPGDHVLDTNITVANVTRLTMRGESSSGNTATVVCSGSVGLSFTSMIEFKVGSLAFTSCSRKHVITLPDIDIFNNILHAAMLLQSTQHAELVNCSFHDNLATALVVNNTNVSLVGNNFTHNRPCSCGIMCAGGAIIVLSSNLRFTGNTTFLDNSATTSESCSQVYNEIVTVGGGAIYASYNTVLNFSGTSYFIGNFAGGGFGDAVNGAGGAIYTSYNTVLNFNGTSNFINNSASGAGGAIYTSHNTVLNFNGTSNFISNFAEFSDGGGAIYTLSKTVLNFNGTSNFINNSANGAGGAIYTSDNPVLNFNGTSNFISNFAGFGSRGRGGAIYTSYNTVLKFNGTSNFINNSAEFSDGGGAIYTSDSTILSFSGTSNFINNSAFSSLGAGGAIYTSYNTVLKFSGTNNFINNLADSGGAIYTDTNNTLIFNGTIYFINNGHFEGGVDTQDGYSTGGGVYMELKSTFSIFPNTTVYWENNHANLGGAIYVADASPISYCTSVATLVPKEECFFQLPGQNLSNNSINVQLGFKNNSADVAGSVLYGGAIDNCKLSHSLESHCSGKVFDVLVHIEDNNETDYNTTSSISSAPLKICACVNNHSDCDDSWYNFPRTVYPGETFQVPVIAVGQRNGAVPSPVRSTIDQTLSPGDLLGSQRLQQARNTCTKFYYTVLSLNQAVCIELHPEGSPCSIFGDPLKICLKLNQNCPPGFSIIEKSKSCDCDQRLAKYTSNCTITNGVGYITRDLGQQFWVGYDNQSHRLILHPHCPLDYCVSHNVTVFTLTNADKQCAHDRSGLLCGRCKEEYSLVLGTSHCKLCTNNYLALLIPFALMGIALVFLLLVCKLTVATGTLSGLVFYANIVGVNRTIFLPVESTSAFSIFIAWINLDFGIETCFYNGLDAYGKTWLQFVFPVYIWVIVGLVILVSRYSQRFSNLLGNNPVSVLATLILLSYTKILRASIAAINITYLEYPKYNRRVWLYDANIDYLSGKHIPLFLVAMLVFLFLFLPYTLLLLFGQWLQAMSHLRFFSWVNSARLRAFLDSYHAPYKAKHRYWPGLLLVLRFTLLLVFVLNLQQDPSINLLAILIGTGMLHFWAWASGGVYRSWCLDVLEGSFALNLIILVGVTSYVNHSEGNQLAVGYTSVSIAFVTFTGILVYHIFLQLRHTKLWKKVPKLNLKFNRRNIVQAVNKPADNLPAVADFSRLREPLLEDLPQPNYGAF